jgi:parallel beta-helix repeat protein
MLGQVFRFGRRGAAREVWGADRLYHGSGLGIAADHGAGRAARRKWWVGLLLLGSIVPAAHAERIISADVKLTANVVATNTDSPALHITASGVTLDLGGFSVIGPRAGKGIGIYVDSGLSNVTIRKGSVTGFAVGILVDADGTGHHLEDVTAAKNSEAGIQCAGGAKLLIEGCTVRDNAAVGLLLENCSAPHLTHNVAEYNATAGIVLSSGTTQALVERNVSRYNKETGIAASGGASANTIRRNTAAGNGSYDLQDDNGDCRTNAWSRNLFITANVTCID